LDRFSEFVDGGVYIIGGFKGNMKVNPGVQQDLELVQCVGHGVRVEGLGDKIGWRSRVKRTGL
jgi:hypothetical protein